MSLPHSSATRRIGLRARSALCLVAMLAAVSACSDSGSTDEEQQLEPVTQVEPDENEPRENENERGENETGRTGTSRENENERGENEPGERERARRTSPGERA